MKFSICSVLYPAIAWLFAVNATALAQEQPAAPAVEQAVPPPSEGQLEVEIPRAPEGDAQANDIEDEIRFRFRDKEHRDVVLHFGRDSHLAADRTADALIAVFGSATSEGAVREAVVSIFGNTRVTGPTGDAAVAVFGNTYVDSAIGGDVVAVFGDVELGPHAEIGGEVVVVGGSLTRDPAAVLRGGVQEVSFPGNFGRLEWLRPWLKHCLLLGRPLAIEPGLGWAWSLAFAFLTLYVLIAVMFSASVEKCVATLETRPGHTLLASVLALLAAPVLTILLTVTVVGIALVPFLWIALFCAGLFGKAVVLATLGRRLTGFIGSGPLSDVAFAVLVGGLIVTGLYLVPFVGFIVYKVLGMIGLGVVVYTLILAAQAKRDSGFLTPAVAGAAPAAAVAVQPAAPEVESQTQPGLAAAAASVSPATPTVAITLPRAGFWIRMGALLIDTILVGVVISVLHNSEGAFLPLLAAYGAVMWKLKGTTVGGILCNLQVVRLDGRELDWGTAIVRALSCFLSLVVAGLGFLWIVFDDQRQSWHDKIAGTVVVRVPPGVSLV